MPRPLARTLGALVALGASALAPSIASAQLTGQSIGAQYLFPDVATVIQTLGPTVVGPGIEFPSIVAQLEGNVGDASFVLRGIPGTGPVALLPAAFNGVRLYDVGGTLPDFLSVTINASTNLPGFNIGRVTWNADEVFVNVEDLVFLPGEIVALDFGFAAVPEPATMALVATGLLGVAAAARRRARG
jgi:hypothetical protein